jgi:hypothetical protein
VGDNTARVLVHSPAPLVAVRTHVGNGLRRWLYHACLRLFFGRFGRIPSRLQLLRSLDVEYSCLLCCLASTLWLSSYRVGSWRNIPITLVDLRRSRREIESPEDWHKRNGSQMRQNIPEPFCLDTLLSTRRPRGGTAEAPGLIILEHGTTSQPRDVVFPERRRFSNTGVL